MIFSFILEKIATIIGLATILRNILAPSFKISLQNFFIQSLSSFSSASIFLSVIMSRTQAII